MKRLWLNWRGLLITLLMAAATASRALADGTDFTTLYAFEAAAPVTFASPLGSQPDTRPVLGPWDSVYGMTFDGGENGNGVIYRFHLRSHRYTVLHVFSAVDANGHNEDGANPLRTIIIGRDGNLYGIPTV
jgi:uncharacterized repeat protein (TIGR03803 family)